MAKKHLQTCPIAAFLNIFGDAWTLLLLREAFYGATRFAEFRQNTGIARNILSDRLDLLLEAGILERVDIGERGTRYEYRLTERGQSLLPVFIAVSQWGNEHLYAKGQHPIELCDRSTGRELEGLTLRRRDGASIKLRDITVRAGPGASGAARKRIASIPQG